MLMIFCSWFRLASRISSSEIEDESVEEIKSMPLLDINNQSENELRAEMDDSSDEKVDFFHESIESEDGSEEHLLDHPDDFSDFKSYNWTKKNVE